MAHFTPRLIHLNSWDVLIFDFSQLGVGRSSNKFTALPDKETINELFSPWLGNPPPKYQLKKYMNLKHPSDKSFITCQAYNNWAIKKILLHYSDSSHSLLPHGEILRRFCEDNRIPYEYVEYYLLASMYFGTMFPFPLKSGVLPSLSVHISSLPNTILYGDSIRKTLDKIDKQNKILRERFALYRTAWEQTYIITHRFERSDMFQEAKPLMLEKGDEVIKRDNKIKNDKRRAKDNKNIVPELPYDRNIRQCLFCGEFYESPRNSDNNYSRHCDDTKCKKSHDAWRQALKRKGETPESIGL